MIRELIQELNYSMFAEIALILFGGVFLAIVVRTLLTSRNVTRQQANVLFDDSEENRK